MHASIAGPQMQQPEHTMALKSRITFVLLTCLVASAWADEPSAQNHAPSHGSDHGMNHEQQIGTTITPASPSEPGQSAFAALQEIVGLLQSDRNTDWGTVDIERLRQHLIDMDNVTLRSKVMVAGIETGYRYEITSDTDEVVASIQRMVTSHVDTMAGQQPWEQKAELIAEGVILTATGGTKAQNLELRGLGFLGLLTAGMHHQAHHLAIARGLDAH